MNTAMFATDPARGLSLSRSVDLSPVTMKHFIYILALLILVGTPLAAGLTVPLTPGKYVLIDANLNKTAISFIKTSEGKLTLSCPSAPSSPSAVLQEGAIFEFSLIYRDPKGTLHCVMFLGYGSAQRKGGDVDYRGSFADLAASQSQSSSAQPQLKVFGHGIDSFILYKLSDNP
jgi:hypothetical protein